MIDDAELQPLTDEEEAERRSLMATAGAGRLNPTTFARVVELNQRQQAADRVGTGEQR